GPARALRGQERVLRHHLRPIDWDLRPAALGQPVLSGVVPRGRVRRTTRSRPCGDAGTGGGGSTDGGAALNRRNAAGRPVAEPRVEPPKHAARAPGPRRSSGQRTLRARRLKSASVHAKRETVAL